MTGIKSELLTDKDMLYTFEDGTRGAICQASYHHQTTNNKYMKNYDKNIESSFLEYTDANLYGWAMIKKTTCRKF